ncbi:general transcription factor 3C polypeptide 3 [Contarinia nasturtii]|uniref:general transcription factor 3C polypeptide 3 n=1 Tax=Contarinia nasturtii TaxID=265458 RepID=UPI0012D4AEAE|nr:general transcription factor 3C polypeptide 3 [Contarinia nasturtii]
MDVDDEEVTYDIEEVAYLNEDKHNNESSVINEKLSNAGSSNNYGDRADEGNLIKRLMNGELSFSEYNKEMDESNISDDDNMIDEDVIEEEIMMRKDKSKSRASKYFEAELHKTRKDAMRGILKGRVRMRDGRQRRRCVLPAALQGLMGEANLRFARGQNDLAEKVCLEIIRQVPLAPEPFLTLAQIHDSNPEKYLQFSLIAAHLNPADSEQWIRIAQFCIEQNDIKRAINCYTKAIKFNPKDIELRLKRIELLESIEDEKMAFRCWYSLVFIIPSEQGVFLLQTAKMVTERLIKSKQYAKALEVMSYAYRKVPELFQNEDLNQLLELLITNNEFKQVIDILCLHTDLQITYYKNHGDTMVHNVKIPKLMILDFRSKLIVSLIHLKAFHLMECLIENIFTHINVTDAGDCYLDVAEALMKMDRYSEAIRLLEPLLKSQNYSLAAVWLRHADCYRAIGDCDKAIASYSQVVAMAPQHFDARLTLAALLKQQGRDGEALRALEQNLESELIDPCVLYERCFMLKEICDFEQYINVAMLLISRHCIRIRNSYEMFVVTHTSKWSNKLQLIRENRKARKEPIEDEEGPEFVHVSENQPSIEEEFNLLKSVLEILLNTNKVTLMQRFTFTALSSKRFGLHYTPEMYFYALLSTIFNRDSNFGFVLIKDLIVKHLRNHRMWNLFNVIIQFTDSNCRYSRFLNRLIERSESAIEEWPKILRANYWIVSGTYKYALNDYMRTFKTNTSPLVALLIGITYMSIAQQKYTTKKHMLISQSISFLNEYAKIREPAAYNEIQYNLGRLHHQFGMLNIYIY